MRERIVDGALCQLVRVQIRQSVRSIDSRRSSVAWVVDREAGRSFFLAAALYTNADGILNDDQYEYETVALPFLAALGEAVAKTLWTER